MSETKLNVKMLGIDEIRPNPFQPRESFPREEIEQLANTIKEVGLLQPISVRKHGKTYQIISGERRWRASQYAGLTEIPAIIKDIDENQLMMESLIENLHRRDLEPIERARGLAEIYKMEGFDPHRVASQLRMIENVEIGRVSRNLTEEEKKIKKIANIIGLSYDYQYRLLTQLRLTSDEQKRVTELKLGYEKISSISTIKEKEDRRELIEIAPTLERDKIKKVTKIIRKGKKPIKDAVLKKEIEPEIAEEILEIKEPEIQEKALDIARKGIYTPEGFKSRIFQLTKPTIELPKDTIDIQIYNKTLWNLERINDYDIYTVGYEKKTLEQFINLMRSIKINAVLDVRKNPVSQYKPEFNKKNLERVLKNNYIEYKHIPELGVTSDIRRKLEESGNYDWFFEHYDKHILKNIESHITDIEVFGYPIAFFCVEFDPTKCHRHRIALWFEARGHRSFDI